MTGDDTVTVFVDFLYNSFDDPGAAHEIMCSEGTSSVFKIKFMVNFLQSLS